MPILRPEGLWCLEGVEERSCQRVTLLWIQSKSPTFGCSFWKHSCKLSKGCLNPEKNLLYDTLMISFLHNIIDIWNITLKYTLSGEVHSFKESHICHIPCKKLYIMITILNPVKELKVGVPRGGIFFNYFFFPLHRIIVNRNLSSFLQRIFQLQLTPLDRNQSHAGIKSLVIVRMQFNTWLLVVATDLLINYYRTNREWRREFSYL